MTVSDLRHRSLEGLVRSGLLVTQTACCSSYTFSNSKVPEHLALRWLAAWCIRMDSFKQLISFVSPHFIWGIKVNVSFCRMCPQFILQLFIMLMMGFVHVFFGKLYTQSTCVYTIYWFGCFCVVDEWPGLVSLKSPWNLNSLTESNWISSPTFLK